MEQWTESQKGINLLKKSAEMGSGRARELAGGAQWLNTVFREL
jgi:hypothetical protein